MIWMRLHYCNLFLFLGKIVLFLSKNIIERNGIMRYNERRKNFYAVFGGMERIMDIGVLIVFDSNEIENKFAQVHEMGLKSCQLSCWDMSLFTEENAKKINEYCAKYDVKISTLWCGWSGPAIWDAEDGMVTLGLVPSTYRFKRMEDLKSGSDFAKLLNVKNVATHVGFIPYNALSTEYNELVAALRYLVKYFKQNGQNFLFETGQETPVVLRRTIEDIGEDNVGINLDPANLLEYGNGNPVDALDLLGKYVLDVHAKDGCYPTEGHSLGIETPLGQGAVDYPRFIAKLKKIGYNGPLTIEREITGEEQIKDIKAAIKLLEDLI